MNGHSRRFHGGSAAPMLIFVALAALIVISVYFHLHQGDVEKAAMETHAPEWRCIHEIRREEAGADRGRVLLVHGGHGEYEWAAGISRGVRWALEGSNVILETRVQDFPMKTVRKAMTVINLDMAGKLGIKPPADLLEKVDIIIGDKNG
ncbi:MAG: hypothetical protein GY859_32485 [Desulfobacterales bacterium]|nr:hypothetical protein [Desulfobacterales bacterium]